MTRRIPIPSRALPVAILAALLLTACSSGDVRRAATPRPTDPHVSTPVPTEPATIPTPTASPAATPAPVPTTLTTGGPAPRPADLVRSDGTPWTLTDEVGHPTILFFGYTHCPDVCPETIATLLEVLDARPDTRVVFITVDPERDTQEFLAQWVRFMPEGMIGVTGSPAAIRRAADLYGVQYARVDTGSAAGYSMSHTAFQYLVDADGDLVAVYPFATTAAEIIGGLDALG